jgi:hypothetical protein
MFHFACCFSYVEISRDISLVGCETVVRCPFLVFAQRHNFRRAISYKCSYATHVAQLYFWI